MNQPTMDVRTIAMGLDAAARPAVQSRMRQLAETGDTKSKPGLAKLLGEAIAVLVANEASFTHAYVDGAPRLAPADAERRFKTAAQLARSRFPVEVIRNADGTTTKKPPPPLPTSSTEPGVVIVTLVLARSTPLAAVAAQPSRAALRLALEECARTTGDDLVAMEVIWSPAEDLDRVSVKELETRHPEIAPLID